MRVDSLPSPSSPTKILPKIKTELEQKRSRNFAATVEVVSECRVPESRAK